MSSCFLLSYSFFPICFFFNDTATTEIYTLSLHDALPISIDDFVISQWLSSGAETSTVPMEIYNATRAAPLPATNAIATVMVVITLASVVAGFLVYRAFTRHERGGTRGALGGVAGLDG